MATLPPILAGPLVRRVEPEAVHFWLASSQRFAVRAELFKLPEDAAERIVTLRHPSLRPKALVGEARLPKDVTTVQLGQRLFVTLLRAVPKGKRFPTDELLFYDIFLDDRSIAEFGLFTPPADTRALATPPADSILYPGAPLPSFFIASELRHLLHGSCHKLHGEGADAFAYADERLRATSEEPRERPALLFLTGDQIYADDVADDAIARIAELGEQLLGVDERLPGVNGGLRALRPGERGRLVGDPRLCGFTSGEARNHLLGFGEFAALHILSWSPAPWTALPPRRPSTRDSFASEPVERTRLRDALAVITRVRRALANVPTYMIFDDHDVTDDWNLSPDWRVRVEGSPLGRRVVANALAAYWAFQGWGNRPADFSSGFRDALEKHLARGGSGATAPTFERTLWGHSQWSFATPTQPVVLAVDLRTQRSATAPLPAAPEPMDPKTAYKAARSALQAVHYKRGTPLLVVSSLPVLGYNPVEDVQGRRLGSGAAAVDFEGWVQSRTGRPRLLRFLQSQVGQSFCVFLSGDVHYAFAANGWFSDGGKDGVLAVLQLTSSSLKNSDLRARLAERVIRLGESGRMLGEAAMDVNLSRGTVNEQGWEWTTQPPKSRGLDALTAMLQQLNQQLAGLPAGDRSRGDVEDMIQKTQGQVRRFQGLLAQRPVILATAADQKALDITDPPTWTLSYQLERFRDGNIIATGTNMGRVELQLPARVIQELAIAEGSRFRFDTQRLTAQPDP